MSLTEQQIKAREGKLTASRVACLMTGDAPEIMRLWRELLGEEAPEDLSHVWPVRLGSATELLNLDWYDQSGASFVTRRGEFVTHPHYEWAGATLDGWDDVLKCPIECKHVGGREPLEVVIDRYQPQMQWQMEVCGAAQCAISIIMGAQPPIVEYIERDELYAAEMLRRGEQFMQCVWDRREPVALDAVPSPVVADATYNMSGNNSWGHASGVWLETYKAKTVNVEAEKILKSLVPPDAKKCFGYGTQITRNRAGSLSLREYQP